MESLVDYFDPDNFTIRPADPYDLRADKAMPRAEWIAGESARRDSQNSENEKFWEAVRDNEARERAELNNVVALDPDAARLKDRLKVSTVVGSHVPLVLKNDGVIGDCPFCITDPPSLEINDDEGVYHCSGCGAHGDVFSFAQQHLGMDFPTAKVEMARAIEVADEATLTRLAALSPLEYDRIRKDEAAAMGCRASMLDHLVGAQRQAAEPSTGGLTLKPPEPWPDAVDGAVLADEMAGILRRYISADRKALDAVVLWSMFAHTHDAFAISPLLAITSPSPACGKSTLLSLIAALTPKPLAASNITSAALFRSVEKWSPSLILDEADTFLYDNDDLRGVLNSGHLRASAFVVRTVGDDHEPRQFRTWCPKAIALIGKLPATLASRAVHIRLQRATMAEAPEPLRIDRLDLTDLLRKAARWAIDHFDQLKAADPKLPAGLHGRDADNWRPLVAIGDAVGGGWEQRARTAALALAGHDDGQTRSIELLADIQTVIRARGVDRITSVDLCQALADMEDRPWPEYQRGKPISTTGIARLLKPFGVKPKQWRGGSRIVRGYIEMDMKDAFARYLGNQVVTVVTALKYKGNSEYPNGTKNESVPTEKSENINENNAVTGVPTRFPGEGDKTSVSAESTEFLDRFARDDDTGDDNEFNWEGGE